MTEAGREERLVGSDRVLAVLIELAEHADGVTLDELAQTLESSKPTVHRALVALRRAGLAAQVRRGTYMLGDEFLRLAFRFHAARPEWVRLEPVLRELADRYGETVHYAVLDGVEVVYRAKVDPPQGAIRLTSSIGGRNFAPCTAVGKVLLAEEVHSEEELLERVGGPALEPRTPGSITSTAALWAELERTRARGYGVDDQENEVGVNCLAVPVRIHDAPEPVGAVSVSALAFRLPIERLMEEAPAIRARIDAEIGAAPVAAGIRARRQ
ncbi:IclR family transcriptional regulator [Glycomyces tarimensis]